MPYDDDDKKSSPIVPFALGGFIVWLLMRKECPPCSAASTDNPLVNPGDKNPPSPPAIVPVYYGADLGFPVGTVENETLFVSNTVPKPGSQQFNARVEVDSKTYTLKKVTQNPKAAATTAKLNDLVRRMKLDASGQWVKNAGY